jgi:hypothetical protein
VCFAQTQNQFNTYSSTVILLNFYGEQCKLLLILEFLHLLCNLFSGWASGVGMQLKKFVLIGTSALCWALWTSMNDIVFDKSPMKTYM